MPKPEVRSYYSISPLSTQSPDTLPDPSLPLSVHGHKLVQASPSLPELLQQVPNWLVLPAPGPSNMFSALQTLVFPDEAGLPPL